MNIQQAIEEGKIKKVIPDRLKAKALVKASAEAIHAAKELLLNETNAKSILRELYEGLRQYCEALGVSRGLKFGSHEVIAIFIADTLSEKRIAFRFDTYRKIRNGINYYGDEVSLEIVKEALTEIPALIEELKKHATQ